MGELTLRQMVERVREYAKIAPDAYSDAQIAGWLASAYPLAVEDMPEPFRDLVVAKVAHDFMTRQSGVTRAEFDALQADVRTLAHIVERLAPFGDMALHPDNEPNGYQRRVAWSLALALRDILARTSPESGTGLTPAPIPEEVSVKAVEVSPRIATPRDTP